MGLLFRLPLMLFELLLRRVLGHDPEQERYEAAARAARPAPTPQPPTTPPAAPVAPVTPVSSAPSYTGGSANGAPPPTADDAIERSVARRAAAAAAPDPEPLTPPRPIGDGGHVDREATIVESFGPEADVGDAGGTITVDEPWDGYASQPATAIVARLRGADPATKAVVALYERGHKNRATVLKATG
jgi:hypothetical protein